MTADVRRKSKLLFWAGFTFIVVGLAVNPLSLGYFLRVVPRPISGTVNLILIFFFEASMVLLGSYLIRKKDVFTFGEVTKKYKDISAILVGFAVLFTLLNLFVYALGAVRGSLDLGNPVARKYGPSAVQQAYLGWNAKDIGKLLQETWSRGLIYEPFTHFKEKPFFGAYVHVDDSGFRFVKNQQKWPPSPRNFNIFVFGGSTTFGYGVRDEETIASYISENLQDAKRGEDIVAVYNFGRGHYYSTQERILYEQLLADGYVPDVALFIDGHNDFIYAVRNEPEFSNRLTSFFSDSETYLSLLKRLPLVVVLQSWMARASRDPKNGQEVDYEMSRQAIAAIERYLANKKIIESISQGYGVRPVFVWQPVPTYKYAAPNPFLWNPRDYPAFFGYPVMADFIEKNKNVLGKDFLYLADMQESTNELLYVDAIHYSAKMSKMIADPIASFLQEYF